MTSHSSQLYSEQVRLRCIEWVEEQLGAFQMELDGLNDAARGETKSTAGDKHETALAMVQLEQDQLRKRQSEWNKHLMLLKSLKNHGSECVQVGNLFEIEKGIYFIATALGKLSICGIDVFVISPSSPMAQAFLGVKCNEKRTFQNQEHVVLRIN